MMHMFLFFFPQTFHKKTFYYLEQLILKHKLHQNALNIKEIHGRSQDIYLMFYIWLYTYLQREGPTIFLVSFT